MMSVHPFITPVFGDTEDLFEFIADIVPEQARAENPQVRANSTGPDSDISAVEIQFASADDGHDDAHDNDDGHFHGVMGDFEGGLSDVTLPSTGAGSSGVEVESGGFSFARPGTDGDTTTKGGKPPKDGGDGGDTGGLLSSYTSGGNAKTSYNITINFEDGGWTTALQQVFIDAANYLSTIILGDISDERVPLFGRVDDLTIDASIIGIDGEGGVLGGAGVFATRIGSGLPAASIMQFDVADVDQAMLDGYFSHIVVHEMVHAMGFGGEWADMGLVQTFIEDGAEVLRFTGANATAVYNDMALADLDPYSQNGVLVEMDGGSGTASVHWDDALFGELLMTGYIDTTAPGSNTLSDLSIAALEDMGYDTIYQPSGDFLIA